MSTDAPSSDSPAKRKSDSDFQGPVLNKESSSRDGRLAETDSKSKRSALPLPVDGRDVKKVRVEMKGAGSPMDVLGISKGLSKPTTAMKVPVSAQLGGPSV